MKARDQLWKRHEDELAEVLGCETTLGSGNKWEKLDLQRDRDGTTWRPLVECKSTSAASYSVKRELWQDIRTRVYERSDEMRPGLAIRFYGEDVGRNTQVLADIVALDANDLAELLAEARRLARIRYLIDHVPTDDWTLMATLVDGVGYGLNSAIRSILNDKPVRFRKDGRVEEL